MQITKTKTYDVPITLLKKHLNLFDEDALDDEYILTLLQTAVSFIENELQFDVVYTSNVLTEYDFIGSCYTIWQKDAEIESITIDAVEVDLDTVEIEKDFHRTYLEFATSLSGKMIITYTSGYADYSTIPAAIMHAIKITIAELYDEDRSTYVASSRNQTKIIHRLLAAYKSAIIFQ